MVASLSFTIIVIDVEVGCVDNVPVKSVECKARYHHKAILIDDILTTL